MKYKHLTYRSCKRKGFKNNPYCKEKKIWNPKCQQCSKRDDCKIVKFYKLKQNKPIKQITYKQTKAEKNRFSILTDDLEYCIICGKSPVNKHEIFYGSGKRLLSIKYGLVIPLCTCEHHKSNIEGIHKDKQLCLKWQIKGQLACMKYYNMTEDEFRKIFGKSYIN